MNKLFFPILAICVFLAGCSEPRQSQYEKGMQAYDAGDFETALTLFLEGAEAGYADAQYKLGLMYSDGLGTEADFDAAMHWNLLAAGQGHSRAMHNIGVMYFYGQGVDQDLNQTARWFRQAAEAGQVESMISLGDLIRRPGGFFNLVILDDYDSPIEALSWYEKAAATGDARGLYNLASAYEDGIDPYEFIVDEDGNYAINPDWQTKLLEPDFDKAMSLYTEAAEAGNKQAQLRLANALWNGELGEADIEAALKWYRLAAEQNEPGALLHLGDIYFEGNGVGQDYAKALGFYRQALKIHDYYHDANTRIGWMYLNGWGTERDMDEALVYLEKGAEGRFEAGFTLGRLYAEGKLVEQDYVRAYFWFKLASRYGVENQQDALDEMERLKGVMSEAEVADAEARAKAWRDERYPEFKEFFDN